MPGEHRSWDDDDERDALSAARGIVIALGFTLLLIVVVFVLLALV